MTKVFWNAIDAIAEVREVIIVPTTDEEAYIVDFLPWACNIPPEFNVKPSRRGLIAWVAPWALESEVRERIKKTALSLSGGDKIEEIEEEILYFDYNLHRRR